MVIEKPNEATTQAEVDRTFAALRASLRPLEFRTKDLAGGHYRGSFTSVGTTVLNANDVVFSMRWAAVDRLFVLKRLRAAMSLTTAFGAAQENALDLVKAREFTAANTGGTAVTLGSGYKLGPNMGNSQIADLRYSGATALGGGTVAVDSVIGRLALGMGNTVGNAAEGDLFSFVPGVDHPLALQALEGIQARIAITQGATGVVKIVWTMEWAEIPVAAFASL